MNPFPSRAVKVQGNNICTSFELYESCNRLILSRSIDNYVEYYVDNICIIMLNGAIVDQFSYSLADNHEEPICIKYCWPTILYIHCKGPIRASFHAITPCNNIWEHLMREYNE
jgi:hypothetical protein